MFTRIIRYNSLIIILLYIYIIGDFKYYIYIRLFLIPKHVFNTKLYSILVNT